jgi:hypothetical protein
MLKRKGLLDGLAKPVAILDVASIVANPWVENVVKSVFSQEQVTQKSDAFCVPVIHPHTPEISDCVDDLFLFFKLLNKVVVVDPITLHNVSDLVFKLLDERNDGFSIVFWNVLCLIFEPLLHQQFDLFHGLGLHPFLLLLWNRHFFFHSRLLYWW